MANCLLQHIKVPLFLTSIFARVPSAFFASSIVFFALDEAFAVLDTKASNSNSAADLLQLNHYAAVTHIHYLARSLSSRQEL